MVIMAVQVRQVVKGDTSISYMVEYGTGRMEAEQYHDERSIPAMKNTFVKFVGVLKTVREQNMVTMYSTGCPPLQEEVTAHQLELVRTPLRIMRQQKMAAAVYHFEPSLEYSVKL